MNRRSFFTALMGGIAAATGIRRLAALPLLRPGDRVLFGAGGATIYDDAGAVVPLHGFTHVQSSLPGAPDLVLERADDGIALPGTAPWRHTNAEWLAGLPEAYVSPTEVEVPPPAPVPAQAVGLDLPEVWPGFSTPISGTAALDPINQADRLMELFGASGDAAPSFAAALIGELVLTRMRLADLRRLHAPVRLAS